MVDLIAKSSFYLSGGRRRVLKGEAFTVETEDQAKALLWYGRAEYAAKSQQPVSGGTYQRRDMQAGPVGTADPAKPVARTTPGEDMSRAASEPPAEPAAEAPPPPERGVDDLADLTRKELYELAEREGVEIASTDLKSTMREKIKAARAARQG